MSRIYLFTKKLFVITICLIGIGSGISAQETICLDGLDNDNDGLTDCFDPECTPCNFDCEYRIPSTGTGTIELAVAGTGSDPDYTEVFIIIDSSGTILHLTQTVPPTFSNIQKGRYLALALSYEQSAGISNLAVNNKIGTVTSTCFEMSDSYAFEVCTNNSPTITTLGPDPLCYCVGNMSLTETALVSDPDNDSLTLEIQISGGYLVGEDILIYDGNVPVNNTFDASTGILTIGPAPANIIEYAVRNSGYSNTSGYGNETAGNRIVSYTLYDAFDTAPVQIRTIEVGNTALCNCVDIAVAKEIISITPSLSGTPGNSDVTYQVILENTGGFDLGNLEMNENLQSQFGNAFNAVVSAPTFVSSTATLNPTLNNSYNGSGSINIFDGMTGVLEPGQLITLQFSAEIDNSEIVSVPLENQVSVEGTALDDSRNIILDGTGFPVKDSDTSDSGNDPKTNNGDGGMDDPTPYLNPMIGVTKSLVSASPAPGQPNIYSLNFEMIVENTGSTVLENIRLEDDLNGWGPALVNSFTPNINIINNNATVVPTGNSSNYNGTSDIDILTPAGSGEMMPGESFQINLEVQVDITQSPVGLQNSAFAEAVPTDGTGGTVSGFPSVSDISDDATDLPEGDPKTNNPGADNDSGASDDPTKINFPASPALTKRITAVPQPLLNRNYSMTYEFTVRNNGGSPICELDLIDNLQSELGCAFQNVLSVSSLNLTNTTGMSIAPSLNNTYNGIGNDNLLGSNGCLYPTDYFTFSVEIEIDVNCSGIEEPLSNQATLTGNNISGTTTYTVESDDSTDLNNDNTPDNESGGLEDETLVSVSRLDVAKDQVSSNLLPNGNYEITFNYLLKNTGNSTLSQVALEDDMAGQHGASFVSSSANSISGTANTLGTLNGAYTGSGNTPSIGIDGDDILNRNAIIAPGQTLIVEVTEVINPNLVPVSGLTNQALGTGTNPDGITVNDDSDDGSNPNFDTDEPTPLDFGPQPEIIKALSGAPVHLSGNLYELTFDFEVNNNGTSAMCFIDVFEDLKTHFDCGFQSAGLPLSLTLANNSGNSISPTINGQFDGDNFTNLFNSNGCLYPGDQLTWSLITTVDASCTNLPTPLVNTAVIEAKDSNNELVTDASDDNTDLDSNNSPDNDSGGNDDPTIIYFPEISMTKALVNSSSLPNGNVELDFRFNIENTGNANLSSLSVTDELNNLGASLVGVSSLTVQNISASSVPAVNSIGFTGLAPNTDFLIGSANDLLKPGQTFTILMTVEVSPQDFGNLAQPVENQAIAIGNPVDNSGISLPGYSNVSDNSDDGTNLINGGTPDSDNPGADNDDGFGGTDDPTIVKIPPTPKLSKTLASAPLKLPNGNFSVTYIFDIENIGGSAFNQINLEENLAGQFGCSFIQVINKTSPILTNNSGLSTNATLNNFYNGNSVTNLLNGDGNLVPGDEIELSITVELNANCSGAPTELLNQAIVSGFDTDGNLISDNSDDDTDLNADNTPDNDSGGGDDPTLLYLPDVAVTKALTSANQLPNGNYNMEFRFNVENIGNTALSTLSLTDALDFAPAIVGAGPLVSVININANVPPTANNGSYNGTTDSELLISSSADRLLPGQSFVVELMVEVAPNNFLSLAQPVENQAIISGTPIDNSGNTLAGYNNPSDTSDDGTTLPDGGDPTSDNPGASNDSGTGNTNDPTLVSLPRINIVKEVTNVQPSLTHGNFYVSFDLVIKNSGNTNLENIQVTDDLAANLGTTFIGLTAGPVVTAHSGNPVLPNTGSFPGNIFDGNSGFMNPNDEIKISFIAELDPDAGGANTPLENQAVATANDPSGPSVTDLSDDGDNPDTDNGDGDFNTPTPVKLPQINIAKELVDVQAASSGFAGRFDATYRFIIENTGNEILNNLSLTEALEDQLNPAFSDVVGIPQFYAPLTNATTLPLINNGFTGITPDTDIFIGTAGDVLEPNQTISVDLIIEIDPTAAGTVLPLLNEAIVSGNSPDGNNVEDNSDNGSNPKTNNNDGGYDDPTPFDCLPANITAIPDQNIICSGESVTVSLTDDLLNATYLWVETSNPNAVLSTDKNPTFTNILSTSTFEVTAFPADGCYTGLTDQITIDVSNKPGAPIVNNTEVCDGSILQLTTVTTADNYFWTGPNGFASNDQNPFVTSSVSIIETGTYSLVIEIDDCLSDPSTLEVSINGASLEQPQIVGDTDICEGDDIVLSTSSIFDTYQWISPAGRSMTTLMNPALNSITGTTTISSNNSVYLSGDWSVYGIDANGCKSPESAPINITINAIPETPTPTSTSPVCLGESVELIANGNYPANAEFAWYNVNPNTPGAIAFSNQKNPTVNNLSSVGVFNFYLTITVSDCTSEPGIVPVTINANPTLTAINDGVNCMPATTDPTLSATPAGGQFPYTFIWNGPNNFNSSLQNPTVLNGSSNISGTYNVTVTDDNGCTAVAETVLDVTSKTDQPIVINNGPLCDNEVIIIETANSYSGTNIDYLWSGPNGSTSAGDYPNSPELVLDATANNREGDYTLVVSVDGCDSDASEISTVVINDAPSAVLTYQYSLAPNCAPSDLQLFANITAGGAAVNHVQWTGPSGFVSNQINPTIADVNTDYNGSYQIEITDLAGCSYSSTIEVSGITNTIATPIITGTPQTCAGETAVLSVPTYSGTNVTYTWNIPGSTTNISGENTPQLTISPVTQDYAANYTVTVVVDGCTVVSAPYNLRIYDDPQVSASNDALPCMSPLFNIILSANSSGVAPITYEWNGPNGFKSFDKNPILPNANSALSGTYVVTATDANGCTAIAETVVFLKDQPDEPQLSANAGTLCVGEEFTVTAPTYNGTDISYEWTGPNGTTLTGDYPDAATLTISNVSAADQGNYFLQVLVDGCPSGNSEPVSLQVVPVSASPDVTNITVCEGELLQLNTSTIADEYIWTNASGFSASTKSPVVSQSTEGIHAGTYELIVKYGDCESAPAQLIVTVDPKPETPNLTTNAPICNNGDLTLNTLADFDTYIWTNPNADSSNPLLTTNSKSTTIPFGNQAYLPGDWTVYGIDANGCASEPSAPAEVIMNQKPDTPTPSTDAPICQGVDFSLYSGRAYPVNTEFKWYDIAPSTPGAVPFSTLENPTLNGLSVSGNYEYFLVISINGCESDAGSVVVEVNEIPQVTADNSGTECVDPQLDLMLFSSPSGGKAPYDFAWTGPNNFQSIAQNPTLPNANSALSGTYIVRITDAFGCTATAETVLDVTTETAQPVIRNNGPLCEGAQLIIETTTAYSGSKVDYLWEGPNGTTLTGAYPNSPQIILDPSEYSANGKYTLTVTVDDCISLPSEATSVEIRKAPEAKLSYQYTLEPDCSPSDLELFADIVQGDAKVNDIQWMGPNGFFSKLENPIIADVNSGYNGSYQLIITDEGGCQYTATIEVSGISDLVAQPIITGSPRTCGGNEVVLTAPTYGGSSVIYTWNLPGTANNITGLNSNQININPVTANHAGNYSITIDVDGCIVQSPTFEVQVADAPQLTASNDAVDCSDPNLDINLTSNISGGLSPVNYNWSGPNGFNSIDQNPTLPNSSASFSGTYTVTATDAAGCTAVAETVIDITPRPNEPTLTTNGSVLCEGEKFIVQAPNYSGTNVTYEWEGPQGTTASGAYADLPNLTIAEVSSADDGKYTLKVTVDGCTSVISTEVTLKVVPVSAAPDVKDIEICEGELLQISTSTTADHYSWVGPNGFTSDRHNPFVTSSAENLNEGIYTLVVKYGNCESVPAEMYVKVYEKPITPSLTSNSPICDDTDLILSTVSKFDTYIWSNPNVDSNNPLLTTSNATTIIPAGNAGYLGGDWNLTGVDDNGCRSDISNSIHVEIYPIPQAPAIAAQQSICSGEQIELSAVGIFPQGTSYYWYETDPSQANASVFSTDKEPIITDAIAPGIYTYWLVVSTNGCESSASTIDITVNDNPIVSASNDGTTCSDPTVGVNLSAAITGGAAPFTYAWTGPNGYTSFDENAVIVFGNQDISGTYSLTITDANGCTDDSQTLVNATARVDEPLVSYNAPVCEGEQLIIRTQAYFGTNVNYEWNGPNGSTSGGAYPNAPEIIISAGTQTTAGDYSVEVTVDGCNSNPSPPVSVIINQLPQPTTSYLFTTSPDCSVNNLELFADLTVGDAATSIFEWSGPNGFISLDQNPVINNPTSDFNGSYILKVTDMNGCSNSLTTQIDDITDRIPAPVITTSGNVCEDGEVILTGTTYQVQNATYTWSTPGTAGNHIVGQGTPELIISPISFRDTGDYYLTVEIDNCTVISNVINVQFSKKPEVDISYYYSPDTNCSGNNVFFYSDVTLGTGQNITYEWSGPNGFTSNEPEPILLQAGDSYNGFYTLIVTDENGCSASSNVQVTGLRDAMDQPVITGTPQTCEGGTVTLSVDQYQGGFVRYIWTVPGLDANITGLNSNQITISPVTSDYAGDYRIEVVVDGCSAISFPFELKVFDPPTVSVTNDALNCSDLTDNVTLSAQATGGTAPYKYSWSGPNGFTAVDSMPVLPVDLGISGVYFVEITDLNGCTVTGETTVDTGIKPNEPQLTANATELCEDASFVIETPVYSGANVRYLWRGPRGTTADGTYPDAGQLIINNVSAADAGEYSLAVRVDGCTSTRSSNFILDIVPTLSAPNADDVWVCESDFLQLSTSSIADEYFWSGPSGFTSDQKDPIVSAEAANIHEGTYFLYIKRGDCTSETAEITVTVSKYAQTPTLQINSPVCDGEDLVLTTSTQCAEYLWIGPDGKSPSTLSNPLLRTSNNTTTIPAGNDAYDSGMWYVICVTDSGCESLPSNEEEMIINEIPVMPTPTNSGSVCENESFQLFAGDNYPANAEYAWYTLDPTSPFAIILSTQKDPIIDDDYLAGFYSFFLTVTVDGCTSDAGSTFIAISESPNANPTNDGVTCSGLTNDLMLSANAFNGVAPYTFFWEGPNNFQSRAENPVVPFSTIDISGTYTVVVTDANGCSSLPMSTVVKTNNVPLTPTLQASTSGLCEGSLLTLFVTPYAGDNVSYDWQLPDGTIVSTDRPSLIIDSVYTSAHHGAFSLSVTVDGCTSAGSALNFVNVYESPAAANVPGDMMVCEGTDVTFQTNTNANSYLWTGPNGYVSRNKIPDAIQNFSALNVGEYQLEVENFNCKSAPSIFMVDMEKRPATPVLNTELTICDGDTLFLETNSMASGYSYQWIAPGATGTSDFGDPNDPSNPIWTNDGSSFISASDHPNLYNSGDWSVRIVSPNGCNSEMSVPVEVEISPIPTVPAVLANGPLCEGEDVVLTTADLPGLNYNWYEGNPLNGGVLISNESNPTLSNPSDGFHEYFLTVEMNGCKSDSSTTASVGVTINQLPSIDSVSNTGPYCSGDSIELFSESIPGATYQWTGPTGFTSTQEDPVIISASAQNGGIYSLTVNNGNCKSEPISMQVLVTEQPITPTAENNGPGCEGTALQLSTPSQPAGGFVMYEWIGPNGFTSKEQNPMIDPVTAADAGQYSLSVSVNGCRSLVSSPTIVEVNPVPDAPIAANNTTAATPACDGETIQLETPFVTGATYSWVGPNGFTSDLANPIIEDANDLFSGTYMVIVTLDGCSSPADTTDVYINEMIEVPVAVSNGPICEGDSLALTIANYDRAINYTWYNSSGVAIGTGGILSFNNAAASDAGSYYVVAEIGGCESDPQDISPGGNDAFVDAEIDVPSKDIAFINETTTVACDDTLTLNAKQIFSGTGIWTLGDDDAEASIISPNEYTTLVANLEPGLNSVVWSIHSGACGITSTDTTTIDFITEPEAVGDLYQIGISETLDTTVVENDIPNTADFIIELVVEPGNGFVELNTDGTFNYIPNPGFIGSDYFEYQLCNANCLESCVTARAVIEIGLDAPCEAPDVFTPNGDGMNETFEIPCLQLYEGSQITIFNRWGDEVFATSNYQNDWDGTYKGESLPVGTYFYILKINDPAQTTLNGYIFLQR